jgi:hypothetical protein
VLGLRDRVRFDELVWVLSPFGRGEYHRQVYQFNNIIHYSKVGAPLARIAVIVPGIMGSVLRYQTTGTHDEIWGANLIENYRRLVQNPDVLKWTGQTANASLLKTIRLADWLPFLKVDLWRNSLEFLTALPEFRPSAHLIEFGYDWRASLIETAKVLAASLTSRVNAPIDSLRTSSHSQFVFLTHSMGGVVVRIALALKLINPTWVDRIIHIGSPLKGAAVTFRVAYERSTLPLLAEILKFAHRKNSALFTRNLLRCFKSFPSLYQLLPPLDVKYLHYSPSVLRNPLEEEFLPAFCRELTEETHRRLVEAEIFIIAHKIKVFTIYTAVNLQNRTDIMYRIRTVGEPEPGYLIEEVIGSTVQGDGTVSAQSASDSEPGALGKSVTNVDHAYLCNSKKVVEILATILN